LILEIKYSKLDFDVIVHYARNDIFEMKVSGQQEIKKEKGDIPTE